MSATAGGGYPDGTAGQGEGLDDPVSATAGGACRHGSAGEEAALLAAAVEGWVRSARDTFGPLLTAALAAGASKAAGFAGGAAAAAGAASAARTDRGGFPGHVDPLAGDPDGPPTGAGAGPAADGDMDADRYADGLFGHLHEAVGRETHGPDGECRYCPVCRVLAALRGPGSEVMEHLAEAGTALLAALRAAIEAHERSWVAGPSVPVEHIDVL